MGAVGAPYLGIDHPRRRISPSVGLKKPSPDAVGVAARTKDETHFQQITGAGRGALEWYFCAGWKSLRQPNQ